MPQQVSGVTMIDNEDGTCAVQIGGAGYGGLDIASFFDRSTFSQDHLAGNMRLARVIGNYGAVTSEEYLARLAEGLHLTDADYTVTSIVDNEDGGYTVGFGSQTVTMQAGDLEGDTNDLQQVLRNIGSFLRIAGYTELTAGAIAAVATQSFWY